MLFLLNLNSFILLFALAINLGLGFYIYLQDRENEINRVVSLLLFLVAFWTGSFLSFMLARSPAGALFWRKLIPTAPAIMTGYFLYFSMIFPRRDKPLSSQLKALILVPGAIFALLSVLTPFMVRSFQVTSTGFLFMGKPLFGELYPLYMIFLLSFFCLSFYNLFSKYVRASGAEKLQLFYVLFGSACTLVIAIAVIWVLPFFGVVGFFALGPPTTLIMAGFVSYAIARHRLLNIDDFLSKGVLFLAAAVAFVGSWAFIFTYNFKYLFPFYAALGNLVLGLYVYLNNRKSRINISFALVALLVVLWTIAVLFYSEAAELAGAFFWSRIAGAISAYIPALFLYFSCVFPRQEEPLKRSQVISWFLMATFLAAYSLSNIIVSTTITTGRGFGFIPGLGFAFYVLYFVVFIGYALSKLLKKYYKYSGTNKLQIGYVFLGFSLASVFPITTNLILPLFGRSELAGIGPFFTIIASALISYAIVKHRLMSIEVVIQRSAVYGIATVLIMALYALAVLFSETFYRQMMGYTSLIITAAAALLIAVAYQPLVRGFQDLTDRLFFRGRYNYQKTLREISHKIASVIRLEELSKLVASSFVDTMKVSEISFLLLDKEKEHFRSVAISLPRYKKIEIDVDSPIISRLSSTRDILFRDELEDALSSRPQPGLTEVRDEMDRLGISIWVPIISKDELIGVIALGHKLSGDIFTTEDIGLLSTLASQTAVALDNARLYDEVVSMKDYSEKILQSMVSGMLTVNNKGEIVTYNFMAEKITGRKTDEVLGRTCEEIWGKRGMISNIILNTLKNGKYYVNFESSLASPERGLVPVSFSSNLLYDHHGKKLGALLSIQDISEVKELEGKVRRADKLSALATMAAGMAHEIKNPLSSMKVLSQLLPKKINDQEFQKKLGEILPREINRIDRIVESLLGFARATELKFEKTDIEDVLEENLKYFEGQAKKSEIKIIRDYAKLPQVEIDRAQLSQVFSNLILNAVQAMSGGGELKVATRPGKQVEDVIQSIKVQVSDTGHGISEEMVKKLFDPFFTTKYGGTGLGLTISHSIVDGHKGYFDVVSKPAKGTTFTVTLPVSQGLV